MKPTRDEEFRHYVRAHRPDLLRTARLLTAGDDHTAEDLVQSTLTKLYLTWSAFRKVNNREAYVRRALINALVDEKRRPWRREQSLPDLPDQPAVEAVSSPLEDDLAPALRQLPPRMRAVVVFRYFHDLSVAETASALGCAEGTVKSQTAQAVERLRGLLTPKETHV